MPSNRQVSDYEPVAPSRRARPQQDTEAAGADWTGHGDDESSDYYDHHHHQPQPTGDDEAFVSASVKPPAAGARTAAAAEATPLANSNRMPPFVLKRGHALSYAGLFLFTLVLYFRPYELFPALSSLKTLAFWVAMATLAIFIPSQITLENNLTARPREVNIVLLFAFTALLSIPLAIRPGEAWETFNDVFLKAVLIFIVMVNAVRTEKRLRWLIFLAVAVGCFVSVGAIRGYISGTSVVEGYRAKSSLGGIFANPNDMAIHLVSVLPVLVALLFGTRNLIKKLTYGAASALIAAGLVVTFSRGAFLGLAAAVVVLTFKLGRRNRAAFVVFIVVGFAAFVLFAPAEYSQRMASIVDHSRDNGSASERVSILIRSLNIALHNPVFGVGMGNFHIVSIHELVSHNSYTQVAAEMGLAALVFYVLFMLAPLKRLRLIERETFAERRTSHFYYLAVGLQGALVAYMVSSFFGSVAYQWYVYYLVGYAVCLRRIYEAEVGRAVGVVVNKTEGARASRERASRARGFPLGEGESQSVTP